MHHATFDHLDALLLESLLPLLLLGAAKACVWTHGRLRAPDGQQHQVLSNWLSLLFLVLPVISRRICSSFSCNDYDDGAFTYLAADAGIDCSSARYDGMFAFAAVMLMICEWFGSGIEGGGQAGWPSLPPPAASDIASHGTLSQIRSAAHYCS